MTYIPSAEPIGMEQANDTLDPSLENKLCSLLISRVQDYAIFMLNPAGKVMTWNEGARLIKGYSRSEIIGQSMSRFYTAEDQQLGRPAELLRQATTNGRVSDGRAQQPVPRESASQVGRCRSAQ